MKSFIEHLSESNDHADKIAFHKEKANWHLWLLLREKGRSGGW